MTIKIDKGIPLPESRSTGTSIYPFEDLEVGHWRNSGGGVIDYINRHVPQVTWNDLTEDECAHFLAMIRHYSREYYERPKQPRRSGC